MKARFGRPHLEVWKKLSGDVHYEICQYVGLTGQNSTEMDYFILREYYLYQQVLRFKMPTNCCVPLCTRKDKRDEDTGEIIHFFRFPSRYTKRCWSTFFDYSWHKSLLPTF